MITLSISDFIAISLLILIPFIFISLQLINVLSTLREINATLIKIDIAIKYNRVQYTLDNISSYLFIIRNIIDTDSEELEELKEE